jgi:hypothetical protein
MTLVKGDSSIAELMQVFMKGAGDLLPIAIILLLALALGDVAGELGTGVYVANLVGGNIPPVLLAPIVFYLCHHDSDRRADCGHARSARTADAGRGHIRRDIWRSCLTHK